MKTETFSQYTKDGRTVYLDILRESTLPFGFLFQDRVQTPRGLATVVGVSDGKLFFVVDGDWGASYWSSCLTAADFRARKFIRVERGEQFRVKKVHVEGQPRCLVMQDQNGVCPIIALTNTLSLKGITLASLHNAMWVSTISLRDALTEFMSGWETPPRITSEPIPVETQYDTPQGEHGQQNPQPCEEEQRCTLLSLIRAQYDSLRQSFATRYDDLFQRCFRDAGVLCTPMFSGVEDFLAERETRDSLVFALAGLRLLHGWVIPENDEEFACFRTLSFNDVTLLTVDDENPRCDSARKFMRQHGSQLTEYGLDQLRQNVDEGEFFVLFRNNHFSTATKLCDRMLCVVSDNAYENCSDIVFEELTVCGSGCYFYGDGTVIPRHILYVISRCGSEFSVSQIEQAAKEFADEKRRMTGNGDGRDPSEFEPTEEELVQFLQKKYHPATASTVSQQAEPQTAPSTSATTTAPTSGQGMLNLPPRPVDAADTNVDLAVKLTDMGFSEEKVAEAMRRSSGSLTRAVDFLTEDSGAPVASSHALIVRSEDAVPVLPEGESEVAQRLQSTGTTSSLPENNAVAHSSESPAHIYW